MRPTVIMKAAMTLDGQLAAADGTSQWITSAEAQVDAHRYRATVDAVMVGAGTLIDDDPRLDVRIEGYDGPQPVPVVVAGARQLPANAKVYDRQPIVLTPIEREVPGQTIVAPDASLRRVDLAQGLSALGAHGIARVMVEGGASLLAALLDQDLIDAGVVYYGQKLAGGVGTPLFRAPWPTLESARSLTITSVDRVGGDVRVEFTLERDTTGDEEVADA